MAVNEYDAIITWRHCDRNVIELQATAGYYSLLLTIRAG